MLRSAALHAGERDEKGESPNSRPSCFAVAANLHSTTQPRRQVSRRKKFLRDERFDSPYAHYPLKKAVGQSLGKGIVLPRIAFVIKRAKESR